MIRRPLSLGKVALYLAFAAWAAYVFISAANGGYLGKTIIIAGGVAVAWAWFGLIETRNADRYNLLIKKLENIQRLIDKADV